MPFQNNELIIQNYFFMCINKLYVPLRKFFIYIWNYFMSDLCELANTFQLYCNHAPVTNVVVFNRKKQQIQVSDQSYFLLNWVERIMLGKHIPSQLQRLIYSGFNCRTLNWLYIASLPLAIKIYRYQVNNEGCISKTVI